MSEKTWNETQGWKEGRVSGQEVIHPMVLNPYDCLEGREKVALSLRADGESLAAFMNNRLCVKLKKYQGNINVQKTRKIKTAKKTLRSMISYYEMMFQETTPENMMFTEEKQAFFNSNLIYLIASTDGNEDNIGHSQLVSRYTLILTRAMGIRERDFQVDIERGASLHDIGKIGIPNAILRKKSALTPEEKEVIEEHPIIGYDLIKEFGFLRRAARVVLFHHECYDGSGYPFGLIGEEIPLEARIFAVADTLDAITSDRPYRDGKNFTCVVNEIEKGLGIQFDPEVVEAFLSIPEKRWMQIKAEAEAALHKFMIH